MPENQALFKHRFGNWRSRVEGRMTAMANQTPLCLRTSAVIGRRALVRREQRFGRRASSHVRDLQIEEDQAGLFARLPCRRFNASKVQTSLTIAQ